MRLLVPCVLLLGAAHCVLGARILAFLPFPGKSHYIFSQALFSALAGRGHQITVYSPFPPPKASANIKHVEVHTNFENRMKNVWTFDSFRKFTDETSYFGFGCHVFWKMGYEICEDTLKHEKIKELLASGEKFDLVLTEATFGLEAFVVFGHIFKAPVINLNGFGTWSVINRVHGNALQIPYHPDPVSFSFTDHMTFEERFRNFASTLTTLFFYYFDHLPKHDSIIRRTLNDPSIPHLEDMMSNMSLTLANFHPHVGYPQPITSNIVPVGGVHISQNPDPLPKDLKDFLDSGKKSVIYFSLGTVVPVHMMPKELLAIFVNVFKKLPYKVLWKIELDSIPDLPPNVKIAKWVPQQSVLAHPNCVLFITHGGLLSQQEAFHAGVPVVGIPFFGDQPFNVRLYEELGTGVKLEFKSLTEQSMSQAILSVVGKPKFIENVKKVSELFRHRAMSPADSAVFWVEYVLRHNGAHHLRPQAALMPWYQLTLLDIAAAVLAVLIALLVVMRKTLTLLRSCCGTSSKKETVSSKKKKN